MAFRLKLNRHGIQSYLDGGHGVSALLHARASEVLSAAQGSAPVDTGDYLDSLHIEEAHTDRLVVRVIADDPKALIIEARYGVLAGALDGNGKVTYTRKDGTKIRISAAQAANYSRGR